MREYVTREYLLRGMSKAASRAGHQAESDLKKAQEISVEAGFPEISYQVHLQLAKLSHSLSAAEGKKHSIAAEDQLTQAKRTLEDIASQIEEHDDREAFLNTGMAELRSSVGKLGPNVPSAPKVHA